MSSKCFLFTTWYLPIRKSHSLFLSIIIAQSDNRHRNREYQPIIKRRLIGDLQTANQATEVCKKKTTTSTTGAHTTRFFAKCQFGDTHTSLFAMTGTSHSTSKSQSLNMCLNMQKVDDCDDNMTPTARRHSSTLYNIEYKHAHWTQLLTVKVACCGDALKLCG